MTAAVASSTKAPLANYTSAASQPKASKVDTDGDQDGGKIAAEPAKVSSGTVGTIVITKA